MPEIETGRTDADVAFAAAAHIAARARAAVSGHGRFCVALSGGRTPWKMLERLIELDIPWNGVHVFQVDERVAPDGDADRQRDEARCNPGSVRTPGREPPPHAGDGRGPRPGMRRLRAGHRPPHPRGPSRSGAPRARRGRPYRFVGARRSGARIHRPGRRDGRTLSGQAADDPDSSGNRPGRGAHVGGHRRLEGADARPAAGSRRDDSRRPRHTRELGGLRRRGGGGPPGPATYRCEA